MASIICRSLWRGVPPKKRHAVKWWRKAAENGDAFACFELASQMYGDNSYAREVGHVKEAAGAASLVGVTEGHDVPLDVMIGVVHWLQKGNMDVDVVDALDRLRSFAPKWVYKCRNEGCENVGRRDMKVCPQCKTARYCGDACQKQDWNTGGHKTACGVFGSHDEDDLKVRLTVAGPFETDD